MFSVEDMIPKLIHVIRILEPEKDSYNMEEWITKQGRLHFCPKIVVAFLTNDTRWENLLSLIANTLRQNMADIERRIRWATKTPYTAIRNRHIH